MNSSLRKVIAGLAQSRRVIGVLVLTGAVAAVCWWSAWYVMAKSIGVALAGPRPPTDESIRALFRKHGARFEFMKTTVSGYAGRRLMLKESRIESSERGFNFIGGWISDRTDSRVETAHVARTIQMSIGQFTALLDCMKEVGVISADLTRTGTELEILFGFVEPAAFGRSKFVMFSSRDVQRFVVNADTDSPQPSAHAYIRVSPLPTAGWYILRLN